MTRALRGSGVGLACALSVLGAATPAEALQEPEDPPFTMSPGARVQVRYTGTEPEGPEDGTNTFRVQRARLSLSGEAYERFSYGIQADLSGSGGTLLDAYIRLAATDALTVWFGQGKAYFGRQWLNSSANLQFVDRTIVHSRFNADRQQGVALLGRAAENRVEVNLGLYNGEGIGRSVNSDNRFMTVGRIVFTPWGSYSPVESAHDYPEDPRLAIGVAGLRNTTGGEEEEEVQITRFNTEIAFKLRGFSATAEVFGEWVDPVGGVEETASGWYVQGGILFPGLHHEVAARVAGVQPDAPNADRTELGLAYSYYIRAHNAKIQADIRNIHEDGTDLDTRELRVQFQLAL
ncbi:MAG: porin [Gemmatimonadota bacterium]